MTLFDGIAARVIETSRLSVNILERVGDDPATPPERTVVLIHGNVSSSLIWQEVMLDLPHDLRVIAIDLRGFGGTEHTPVDATRGVRDFTDDIAATLDALEIPSTHLVGWSLGGGVVLQYALEHPVQSLTLLSPVSPYGFGGTSRDGSRLSDDDAGTGAGSVNPDFAERLNDRDVTTEAPTSPRSVFRSRYVASGYASEHEDVWVESMLSTSLASGNYPGDSVGSERWPGFAPGESGVLNALAPKYFNVSGIVGLPHKPPIAWVHGSEDPIVSDTSFYDYNYLGQLGIVPDWPGADIAPPQLMVTQTRDVLEAYRAAGGDVTEVRLEGVGHSAHLEAPAQFRHAILAVIGYLGAPADPAPPTEAIIITSID